MKKLIFTTMTFLLGIAVHAQVTKSHADDMVMSLISNTNSIAYGRNETINGCDIIKTADGVEIRNPYEQSYVYYIDDLPEANWAHPCRYCFVNVVDGSYTTENQMFYPEEYDNYNSINRQSGGTTWHWPYTNYTIPQKASPNGKLYAVLIAGAPGDHAPIKSWYNLSCVYTALVNKYGFMEATEDEASHIIVTAPDKIRDIVNDIYGNSINGLDLNQSGGFFDEYDFFDEIEYSKTGIQQIFQNLAESTPTLSIPELTENDQLFVLLCGHGGVANGNSFFILGDNSVIYDYELTNYVRNIKCSQMTFLIDCCYSGGFIDNLMNDATAACKNRAVHTATDANNYGYVEQHITKNGRALEDWHRTDEYLYYWTAASLGYYPILETYPDSLTGPWYKYENTGIGEFRWELFPSFNEGNGYSHEGYDINPDTDRNGVVTMDEAFVFANNLDSYSTTGYFNPYGGMANVEYPSNGYESDFTKELITLNGYKGNIHNNVETTPNRRYVFSGSVRIERESSLTINNGCMIEGDHGVLYNLGSLRTATRLSNATFRNLPIMNSAGDDLYLSNCLFDTCGSIITYDAKCSILNSTFNETRFEANTNNPPRDAYNVNLVDNTFNNNIDETSVFLRKIPGCNIINNEITSGADGILIQRLTNTYQNNVFSGNYIHHCNGSGFVSYNSNGILQENSINDNNGCGIKSLNLSTLYVTGDSTALYMSQTQRILDNRQYQVYASSNSYPYEFKYNVLHHSAYNDTILFYESPHERYNCILHDVTNNCWKQLTNNEIASHLYTDGGDMFTYLPTWILGDSHRTPTTDPERMLSVGNNYASSGEYDEARNIYMTLISTYPESSEAVIALNALFAVEAESDGDYEELRLFYQGFIQDDYLGDVADKLANRCNVEIGNYTEAIEWYEEVILNPNTSYSDKTFAEIDLGELYLSMDDDGGKTAYGKIAELIPESREAHAKRTSYLISQLPKTTQPNSPKSNEFTTDGSGILSVTCSPNPTNDKIQLRYKLENDSDVKIVVCDILGKEIKNLNFIGQQCGIHNTEIDITEMPAGIYLISIVDKNGHKNVQKIAKK